MDTSQEKKWFVYIGDHHEGPFTVEEVQNRMSGGQVTAASYVWAEGMADWKLITEVSDFSAIFNPKQNFFDALSIPSDPAANAQVPDRPEAAEPIAKIELSSTAHLTEKRQPAPQLDLRAPSAADPFEPKPRRSGRFVLLALLLLGAGTFGAYTQGLLDPFLSNPAVRAALQTASDAAQPLLLKLTDKVPALAEWISPIPRLDDVAEADYDELRKAAMADFQKEGPRVAVALSNSDPLMPTFYVATNLPDGAAVEVYVEGVSETLLNQLSFGTSTRVTVQRKLGRSQPVRMANGQAIPRGQYEIYAVESEAQNEEIKAALAGFQPITAKVPATLPKGFKALGTRSYFLGGKKDETYTARLREFHEKLKEKAVAELAELKQFATLLETQLNATTGKFGGLFKGKLSPAKKKAWAEFHKGWEGFSGQMNASVAKWTPVALDSDFFYGTLYALLKHTHSAIEQVHSMQNEYLAKPGDAGAFEIQIGQTTAVAASELANLKARIDQAEKIPPSPNGMPRREGL